MTEIDYVALARKVINVANVGAVPCGYPGCAYCLAAAAVLRQAFEAQLREKEAEGERLSKLVHVPGAASLSAQPDLLDEVEQGLTNIRAIATKHQSVCGPDGNWAYIEGFARSTLARIREVRNSC